jgi:hypothetical protein
MAFSNDLTPAQVERLALLAEECGEVIQIIGKILRHGYDSCHPDGGISNRELLEKEWGDAWYAADLLGAHDLTPSNVVHHVQAKREKVGRYLHHQDARGQPISATD